MSKLLPMESDTEKEILETAALNFLRRNIEIAGRGDIYFLYFLYIIIYYIYYYIL